MAAKRLGDYPKVPSTFELGYKVSTSTTRGYWVLKGTPMARIKVLSKALVKAMKHKTFANYLATAGLTVEDSVAGYKIWDKHIKVEYETATAALKELGLLKKKK
jgi:tripartite-type tricarboxylate transporter receptor subunit TctC